MREQLERVGHERVVIVVAAVHRPAALPALPGLVLLARHGGQVVEDGAPRPAFGGHAPDDIEPLGVGIGAAHGTLRGTMGPVMG